MAVIRKLTYFMEGKNKEFKLKYSAKESEFYVDELPSYYAEYLAEYKKDKEVSISSIKTLKGVSITCKTEKDLINELRPFIEFCNKNAAEKTDYILIHLNFNSTDETVDTAMHHWKPTKEQIDFDFEIVQKVKFGETEKFIKKDGHELYAYTKQLLIPATEDNLKFCNEFRTAMILLMKKIKERFIDSETLIKAIQSNVKLIS